MNMQGNGWRRWSGGGGRSTLSFWGLQPTEAMRFVATENLRWQLTLEMRRPGEITVLGEGISVYRDVARWQSSVDGYFTTPIASPVRVEDLRRMGNVLRLKGLIWRGGSSEEYPETLSVKLSPEQYETLAIWLDEVEEKGGLSGLSYSASRHRSEMTSAQEAWEESIESFARAAKDDDCEGMLGPLIWAEKIASAYYENAKAAGVHRPDELAQRTAGGAHRVFFQKCRIVRK